MIKKAVGILIVLILLGVLAFYKFPKPPSPPVVVATYVRVTPTPAPHLSKAGEYQGYSYQLYHEVVKTSQYITLPDGTMLAADIFRPVQGGEPVNTRYPVIWNFTPWYRQRIEEDCPWFTDIVKFGYVQAVVDMRGTGASFGSILPGSRAQEAQDAYDVTEWLAAQPWSDGNVGMYGLTYSGEIQYLAAALAPPHLKTIFPSRGSFDGYDYYYPGGISNGNYLRYWNNIINGSPEYLKPVDEDRDQALLDAAIQQQLANGDTIQYYSALPYRDSLDDRAGIYPYTLLSDLSLLKKIGDSGISIYQWHGWNALAARDGFFWYKNLPNTQKIVIGPWSQYEMASDIYFLDELRRWFDFSLKGIKNGIMDEPPISYYTMGNGSRAGWHSAWQWPLPEQKLANFYFGGEHTGTVKSVNDGSLSRAISSIPGAKDFYTVNYSAGSGYYSRWVFSSYQDLRIHTQSLNDRNGLTYTTTPFTSPLEVTGHPIVHFWITSTARDGDFFVYLEDVTERGESYKITEGMLRASHRLLSPAPYDNLGLPYHRSYAADVTPLPRVPVELVFDLLPTSYVLDNGHRLRVTITCADEPVFDTPQLDPPPTVTLYRDADHPSYIVLPVIP